MATKAFAAGAEAFAVAIGPWGRIIVAGTSADKFAIACFTASGDNCAFFGTDSKATTGFTSHSAEAWAIAIDSDGRIVVGGMVERDDNQKFAVARYNSSGSLDSTFGTGGKVVYDVAAADPSPYTSNVESISGIAIDSVGRIVAAGTFSAQNVSPRFALMRFHGNGVPDAAFGPDSTGMTTAFGECSWAGCLEEAIATSLALQPNGKIVVAGGARLLGSGSLAFDVALARFLPDGSRDSSGFGIDGYVLTDFVGQDAAYSVKIAGGRLFVAGSSVDQYLVAKYSISNGALDPSFDGGVVVGNPCPPGTWSPARDLVVQSFPCRGILCVPTREPVIVGACLVAPGF